MKATDTSLDELRELRATLRALEAEQLAALGYRDAACFERVLEAGELTSLPAIGWVAMDYAALPSLGERRSAFFLLEPDRARAWVNVAEGIGFLDAPRLASRSFELDGDTFEALGRLLALDVGVFEEVPDTVYDGGPTTLTIRAVSGARRTVACTVGCAGTSRTLALARLLWRAVDETPRGAAT